jgi:cobalt-zinc-cadmium efflux system membrane fusion protein
MSRRGSPRTVRLGPVVLVLGALVADAACKRATPDPPKKEDKADGVDVVLGPKALEAARLKTGKPTIKARRTTVVAAGTIDFAPSRVARVGPSVGGRVGTIAVVPGQKVGKGARLVTIESVDVGRAKADYDVAKSRLDRAAAELEREQTLFAQHATSERAVLTAQTEKATAESELHAAQSRLATLGVGGAVQGQSMPLLSPLTGTVLELNARVGQPVGPTDTLVVVGETDQVWLAVDVYERDLGKVHVGDEVHVSSVAYPNRTFAGRVDLVATTVDPERHVLEARIVLDNKDGALRPGMTATARILGSAGETDAGAAIVVPRGAIQTIDGQPFVFVERGPGKFEMRGVERGTEVEGEVEITRGLSGDETLVTDGTFILKSEALKAQMGAND